MVSYVPFLGIHANNFVLRKNDFVASILRPLTIVTWLKQGAHAFSKIDLRPF